MFLNDLNEKNNAILFDLWTINIEWAVKKSKKSLENDQGHHRDNACRKL